MDLTNTNRELSPARELAATTQDAYSYRTYGTKHWLACCEYLLGEGYHPIEADAILRSKLMRFAADGRESARARATVSDLAMLLTTMRADELTEWINECVVNINFPQLEKLHSRDVLRLAYSRS